MISASEIVVSGADDAWLPLLLLLLLLLLQLLALLRMLPWLLLDALLMLVAA
jgi:hypothetical protein